ncbi:thioesterase domain-containing protein [Bacillus cereus]
MNTVKLICLPYAGGSARIYNTWVHLLDEKIEVVCPELAGRGKRFNEPFYKNLKEAVDDIYKNIEPIVNSGPYALFGHSMGSLLTFELYYKLKREGHCEPEAIFFQGKLPRIYQLKKKCIYIMKSKYLKKYLV